jgi:hypothetical protein
MAQGDVICKTAIVEVGTGLKGLKLKLGKLKLVQGTAAELMKLCDDAADIQLVIRPVQAELFDTNEGGEQ